MASMTARTDKDEAPRLTKWDWERAVLASDLRRIVRQLLLTLGVYMDGDGSDCFPSADTIAAGMGCERGTVFDLLSEAEEAGWLTVVSKGGRASGSGGSGKTNLYLPRVPTSATVSAHPTVAEVPARGATVSGHRDQPSGGHPDQPSGGHPTQPDQDQTKDQTKNQEEEARAREVDATVEVGPADVAEMIDTAVRLVADVEPGQARKVEQSPKVAEAARSAVCRGLLAADLVLAWQEQENTAFTSSGTATAVHVLRRLGSPLPARKATGGTGSAGRKTGWKSAPGTVAGHGTESSKVLSGW